MIHKQIANGIPPLLKKINWLDPSHGSLPQSLANDSLSKQIYRDCLEKYERLGEAGVLASCESPIVQAVGQEFCEFFAQQAYRAIPNVQLQRSITFYLTEGDALYNLMIITAHHITLLILGESSEHRYSFALVDPKAFEGAKKVLSEFIASRKKI